MVGFSGAFLMRILKKKKYHPSTVNVISQLFDGKYDTTCRFIQLSFRLQLTCLLIVLMTIFLGIGTMSYGFFFAILGRPYEPFENAAYGPITRTLIAVPVISIVLLHGLRRMGGYTKYSPTYR